MIAREVPFSPTPQLIAVSLQGVIHKLTVMWNAAANCWVMDIADANGAPINCGIPLICGADLLAQYEYLGIGGQMIVQTDHNVDAPPTFDNLGITGHLYYLTPE